MRYLITVVIAALSLNAFGQGNYSMSFDGIDDYVQTNLDGPAGNSARTFQFWLKTNNLFDPNGAANGLIAYGSETFEQLFEINFGTYGLGIHTYGAWAQFEGIIIDNNYHHYALVIPEGFNIDEAVLYQDGEVYLVTNSDYAAGATSLSLNTSNEFPIQFGKNLDDIGNSEIYQQLDGQLDEISIWSSVLPQEQIQQYINCPPSGDEEGLVGYWNFDEGSGTTAFDQTANGNNGTINGATWSTDVPEQSCPSDCTDSVACNYNPDATEDDGSCDYTCCPGPGCCLDGTVWSDELEGCVVEIPTDTNLDGCTDLNDLMDILAAYGDCGVPAFTCGDSINHDGYDYSTVQIGEQCWFSENCRYLPVVSPSSAQSTTDPYYYVYDYQGTDVADAKATDNYATYGVLYNWPAVITEDICPSGWNIPSDGEWQTMEIALGMSEAVASSVGWRGAPVGDHMKSDAGWNGWNGTNSSGFNGLPGGGVQSSGFADCGNSAYPNAYWWSSSASDGSSSSWRRTLNILNNGNVLRIYYSNFHGSSARCIKD